MEIPDTLFWWSVIFLVLVVIFIIKKRTKKRCDHPFNCLAVEKEQTAYQHDDKFYHVEYHLFCLDCGEVLTLKHAGLIQKQRDNIRNLDY